MDRIDSGNMVKLYRNLLKISQKEAAGTRMSHSMVSLIESGKIQLTTVTAMILADNFNKIAASKGIELNLSLKDLLSNDSYYIKENIRNAYHEALKGDSSAEDFNAIFEKAKENNCFDIMGDIKLTLGRFYEQEEDFNAAIKCYNLASEYYRLIEDYPSEIKALIFQTRCYNRVKRYDMAEDCIGRAMNDILSKHKDDNLIFMANMEFLDTLIHTNRNPEALKLIEKLLKSKKLNTSQKKNLIILKSNIYFEERRFSSVISLLKKLLMNDSSEDYLILHKLSLAYFVTQQEEEGLIYQDKCILALSLHADEANSKIAIDFAEELSKYGFNKYSIRYYDYALLNSEVYNQEDYALWCYKSIFNILSSNYQLNKFENYASHLEQLLVNSKCGKNLTQYILLLSKFYLKTSQVSKLQTFIDVLENAM
ncbi:helix-turn-helix domain-containing protein [Clostridium thermarum]|uniref:helix-turn-helix domain-containing protein n=1 Tax=Clostridium thermarum TaxID=1716543 RepID=UPI00111F710C|nr:helix-turn-helix transcriptional regulator [Clostridium thermarum]